MEAKNLIILPIEEISAEELSQLQLVIADELENRRTRAKEAAWDKLTKAIKDYVIAFGDIEVFTECDTFYMGISDNFTTTGEIQLNFE